MNDEPQSYAWPILIICLALATAGVWKLAPVVYKAIPPEAIAALRDSASRCFGPATHDEPSEQSLIARPATGETVCINDDPKENGRLWQNMPNPAGIQRAAELADLANSAGTSISSHIKKSETSRNCMKPNQ